MSDKPISNAGHLGKIELARREVDDYANLFADHISENGLIDFVVCFARKILDGRNKWLACKQLNFEPETIAFEGKRHLVGILNLNKHSSHLNGLQPATN
jgi:hypothetical protein